MKRIALATGVGGIVALGIILFFVLRWLGSGDHAILDKNGKTAEVRFGRFLPTGWQVTEIKEEVLKEINLPFLRRKLVGKQVKVAEVRGPGVYFKSNRSPDNYHNKVLTEGRVVLLAETGQLVRIQLYTKENTRLFGQQSVDIAESLYQRTSETFVDLPPAEPQANLQAILNSVYDDSLGSQVEKSQRIEAAYVVSSRPGIWGPTAFWVVNCFGFPPRPHFGLGRVSPKHMTFFRYLVNAKGEVERGDNLP